MPAALPSVREATEQLLSWCRSREWSGHDPYDGLNSRVFQALPLRHFRWPRLILIQAFKRSPVNLRWLLRVPRDVNPKGLALFLSSLVRLEASGLASAGDISSMAERLMALRSKGWSKACWGYNFDWQTRSYLVPRYYPNIICTTFAGEALLDAYSRLGDPRLLAVATEAGRFVLEDLHRTPLEDGFCFSYTPLCPSRVHNASLLGAALLARLFSLTGVPEFREAAESATRYGIRHQQPDGSWIYGEDPKQGWVDSFHTGYNLLALRSVARHLGAAAAEESLRKGFEYYRRHFFDPGGVVKYFDNRVHPIDSHGVAHAILTLTELEDLQSGNRELAEEILRWAFREIRNADGSFYYQKGPWYSNRIPYMRWTQAWMLLGMATYLRAARITPDRSQTVAAAR